MAKKSKEENLKLKNELKQTEAKLAEQEQESAVIKRFESTNTSDFQTEKQKLGVEVRSLKEEIKRLAAEIAKRDFEVHSAKLELEKCRIEILDAAHEKRRFENEAARMEEKLRERSPVMMRNEVIYRKDNEERRNKKACISELDQMVKQYRTEFAKQKPDDKF